VTWYDALAIPIMALAVYLPKALPLVLVSDRLPPAIRRWLDYVAPAVLGALVAPSIAVQNQALLPLRLELLAFAATFVVAISTRRMLPSVAAGMAVILALLVVRSV